MTWRARHLRGMTLRWRLVIAFLSVSVVPVLIASFIAAQLIVDLFADRMERWLADAARFVVQHAADDQVETQRAASILARALESGTGSFETAPIAFSSALLTSVGYDVIAVYDEAGHSLYFSGPEGPRGWLPRDERSAFFITTNEEHRWLLLGTAQRFTRGGKAYFVFVADRWDGTMLDMASTASGLHVQVFAIEGTRPLMVAGSGATTPIPASVFDRFAGGADIASTRDGAGAGIATGFAAVRDLDGRLVGIVTCRLATQVSLFSHVRTLELFVILSGSAGALSLGVGLWLSALIARPLRDLTGGLRRVAEGDYRTRIAIAGGRELSALAEGFNAMAHQLEELRRREAEVRRRQQLAALGEAAAVMAHEIRNPLSIIKTSSQVLIGEPTLAPRANRMIGFVVDEVDRIDHLVRDFLDYARPKAPLIESVDILVELGSVLEFAAADLARRRIDVHLTAATGKTLVAGDAAQLHQVFLNILLNAAEAMPDGGVLSIDVERDAGRVAVRFTDSGTGIPAEVMDRIFDPFVTTKPRGTGLGLARVRHVIDQHGGTVVCENVGPRGARFTLTFPVHPAA